MTDIPNLSSSIPSRLNVTDVRDSDQFVLRLGPLPETSRLGSVRASVLSFLIDAVIGITVDQDPDSWSFTSNMTVRMNPVPAPDYVDARGWVLRDSKRSATGEARLVDDTGALVAYGAAGFASVPRRPGDPAKIAFDPAKHSPFFRGVRPIDEPLVEAAGIRVIDGEAGVVEVEIVDELRNPAGALQGAMVALVAEVAAEEMISVRAGRPGLVCDLDIRYLSQARVGPVRTRSEWLGDGPEAGILVELHDLSTSRLLTHVVARGVVPDERTAGRGILTRSGDRVVIAAVARGGPSPGRVIGPEVNVPGSETLRFPFALTLLVVLVAAVAVALVIRLRRRRRGDQRRPIVLSCLVVAALISAGLAVVWRPPPFFVPEFPALPRLLPDRAFFYRTAVDLPVAADSPRWIASQNRLPLGAGNWGSVQNGVVFGIPFNPVDERTPLVDVHIVRFPDESYTGRYPMADPAYIQSMPTYGFDNHYVAVDPGSHRMWELLSTRRWFGRWEADSGALWDLRSLEYPKGRTTASGLPILPGAVTYADFASGRIDHVLEASTPTTAANRFVWPARNTDGRSTAPDAPPMGSWLRLKPGVVIDDLAPQARVIAQALKTYGMVLYDTGPGLDVNGTPDRRWDDAQLATLRRITADDFEVVDPTGIKVADGSMESRPAP